MTKPYTYPGLLPYAHKAADDAGLDDHLIRARVGTGPLAEAITTALAQIQSHAVAEKGLLIAAGTVAEVKARIAANLKALDVQRDALEAAVADVYAAVDSVMEPPHAEAEHAEKPRHRAKS
jgi:hypothetical protein